MDDFLATSLCPCLDLICLVASMSLDASAPKAKVPPKKRARKEALETEVSTEIESKEPEVVLRKLRVLKNTPSAERAANSAADGSNQGAAEALEGITEVLELNTSEVSSRIEDLVVSVVSQILKDGTFELTVPNRGSGNQIYLEGLDRNVLGDKVNDAIRLNSEVLIVNCRFPSDNSSTPV
jgi:hypothetical protein